MDRQDRPDPDDRWLVPKQEYFGTEVKLSHEFLTGMLRAAGGTLTWTDGDMVRTLNSRIEMLHYADPKRYVIRLVEEEEESPPQKDLPPRRGGEGSVWTDPETGLMWRYHRHNGWWRRTPPDNELVWWSGGFRD